MSASNMTAFAPLARVNRCALLNSKITVLRSAGARLFAVLILALPLAARADGSLIIMDRAQSHVDIAVKATLGSFVAHLEDFDAAISMDPESERVGTAAFHADLSAVKTGIADRDHNMIVWLQANEFPQVVFELKGMDRGSDGALTARGRFQLHGQTHDISFPVRVTVDRGLAAIDGTASLDTRDFGLPIIRFFVLTVDPVVQVKFHLKGSLAR